IDASLAATGILLVFATSTVLSMSGRPDRGSIRWGNSTSTSVISLPRSPHPMYTTTLESAHFAIWCNVTVFPVPKPPGIAPVPPFAIGKYVSITRCPVINGTDGSYLSVYGRGLLTGHL